MVFSSHIFIFYFLPFVLLVYYLLPGKRNLFLLLASYAFYGWWNPWFVLLMLFVTVANYAFGQRIAAVGSSRRQRRLALGASVVVSLATLGFFKYFMFVGHNLNWLLDLLGIVRFPVMEVVLPVGISFYVFQSLSYTIDVYRGQSPPVRSFFDFACFVSLFPQLIAGPIIRYNTIADQLVFRTHTLGKFSSGAALFILGLAKKVLLANTIGQVADAVFNAQAPSTLDAWLGATAYAFQIYFDFSGYSDMAIGLGRMLGFEFPRNFNAPYLSQSITDFWRRWHISLSTFLRDYLYFPLGGNRRGPARTYFNLAAVMLLGGLWHGADWTFVLWGAYHGGLLIWERAMGKSSIYARLPRPARIAITFLLLLISWVLFRSASITDAWRFLGTMFGGPITQGGSILLAAEIYTRGTLIIMAACALAAFQPVQAFDWVQRLTRPRVVLLILLFWLSLMTMSVQAFDPFLYFQF